MTLDLTDIERGLRGLEPHYRDRAVAGLRAAAPDAESLLKNTTAHGDITGATRAGYRAVVVSPGDSGAGELSSAILDVERLNPGASDASSGVLPGGDGAVGVVMYSPTNYQADLEAGQKATLAPTLAATADDFTRRAARGQ